MFENIEGSTRINFTSYINTFTSLSKQENAKTSG